MKAKIDVILFEAIERGVENGYRKAFKHTDTPDARHIQESIMYEIGLNIYEVFSFEDSGIQ
jgi:hypothetical protein